MKIAEIKEAKDQRPFQPFLIRMADGREIEVLHPDAIAWEPILADEDNDNGEPAEPLTAICVVPGGRREIIELALVTSLGLAPAEPRQEGSTARAAQVDPRQRAGQLAGRLPRGHRAGDRGSTAIAGNGRVSHDILIPYPSS